ncbi:hypothetical protein BJP41_03910 [Candidatus Williamhamiltonella defendens]|uniref:Uncharacterized protein n=2 Tax=Candidatus Williamhamiltonella defendens TaxID=138072 RepID=A0A2D3T1F2_9ENTR|nr:hypothetical protein BJP41_03910 [Candidatus Hamiltonella defensa]ATW31616.1 hypothetical protein BJP42_03975 [Candidatus Hamiltonella defensa]
MQPMNHTDAKYVIAKNCSVRKSEILGVWGVTEPETLLISQFKWLFILKSDHYSSLNAPSSPPADILWHCG